MFLLRTFCTLSDFVPCLYLAVNVFAAVVEPKLINNLVRLAFMLLINVY